ncbi:peptidoglycan-binding domain-containing protein [Streptomyces chromofuscus]|uniref:Peptidoglycan-binding protein n=1 Tax=Streptomyces chromofuscus TaxID=42881 RepID=A0A7M2T8R5_STRCW|nr:peptidoglycan-binding domain-containing protein [Streptomyces chromofuscus]QOV44273.1 peptidoglycan-binding protein [Streptomyces chromofuscus]GGT23952.1 peptidoglycan-binding protein [Streptomyces chromofuscus]
MKKRSASILSVGALLAGLLGGAIATASSAAAVANYECNTSKQNPRGSYYILMPHQNYAPADPYWCYLKYGSQNSGVSALQFSLNKCYGAGLAVDGIYGNATRAAVVSLQQRLGIGVDGEYGPQTRDAMNWSYRTSSGAHAFCAKS